MQLRNLGMEVSEAAGHLLAELDIVRDDLVHGRLSMESARARLVIIRARARLARKCAVSKSFAQLEMKWNSIVADAEELKRAHMLLKQISEPAAQPC